MATLEVRDRGGQTAVVLIDDEDVARVSAHQWAIDPRGHVVRFPSALGHRRVVYLRREIVGATHGDRLRVEHANGNKRDFRRANLVVRPAIGNAE